MRPYISRIIVSSLVLLSTLSFAADNAGNRVIAEALKPSSLENNLRHLTDEIGGRVPGTPGMEAGVAWGVSAFKAAGADSVHTEDFTIPHSWAEGKTELSISSTGTALDEKLSSIPQVRFDARVVSAAWAPALAPVKHVPIVDVGDGTEQEFAKAGDISGKILLVHSVVLKTWADLFGEYDKAPPIITRSVKGKARAIIFMSTRDHDLLYRHTNSVAGEIDRIPMVLVAREDGERIARLLASGHPAWADLSIPNKIGGAFKTSNVVAELRGSEKPEEYVVLGAHLDSWELGTGALDNGCNSALVIDALRAIKDSGVKPRRSIRFVLFSGEEQGLMGSRAYAASHKNELDRIVGVVIYDSGTGKTTGFSVGGRKDLVSTAAPLIAPLAQFGVTQLSRTMETGTDHFDFMLEGVPTFVADQEESNYLTPYHATSDTFDKVDLAQLKKHVAEAAYMSFALADLQNRIGPRLTRAQIEQDMKDAHLDEEMKNNGMWEDWANGKRGRQK
jgi:hypothetical protein